MNNNGHMVIQRIASIEQLFSFVDTLYERVQEGTLDFIHSTPMLMLPDSTRGPTNEVLGVSTPIEVKEVLLVAAMAGATVIIQGDADTGKTLLARLVLNALLGADNFQVIEINRGMSIDELVDIDVPKLKQSSLRNAISEAPWLEKPGKLIDELNRAPAQLINLLQHVIDGKGVTFHGLSLKVGHPYVVNGAEKRYHFVVATMNNANTAVEKKKYKGVFEMDYALMRRLVLPISFDLYPPSHEDMARIADEASPHVALRPFISALPTIIAVNESLDALVPVSGLARLFRAYISGMSNCTQTRSGRFDPEVNKTKCPTCRLHAATPYCGRVSAPAQGRLTWVSEVARALAVLRAVKTLRRVEKACQSGDIRRIQSFTGSRHKGVELFEEFRRVYLGSFQMTAEDLAGSYSLLCPTHVWIHDSLLRDAGHEGREEYVLAEVARKSFEHFKQLVERHHDLLAAVEARKPLTPAQESELMQLKENEDCAMSNVIAMLEQQPRVPSVTKPARVSCG